MTKEAAAQEKSAIHSIEMIALPTEDAAALLPIAQQTEGAVSLLKEKLAADCLVSWASAKNDLVKNLTQEAAELLNQNQLASVGSALKNQIQVNREANQDLVLLATESVHPLTTEKELR